MTERRFDEAEAAAIFKSAAESQHTTQPLLGRNEGMTLAQLQEIGREVGIAPEQIEAASKAVELSWRPSVRRFLGIPVGVGLSVDLNRRLSDDEWERLVVDLRETFDARGKLKQDGSFRQWSNGNLQALLEPAAGGQRLRLKTEKGEARGMIIGGFLMLAFAAASVLIAVARGRFDDLGLFTSLGTLATAGAVMLGFGAIGLPRWARLRRQQMEHVATRAVVVTNSEPATLKSPE